ncbi:phosphotransferase [Paenibacillus cisolokensis]|uniref:phosphotransferase n=1 Tax=Paenibacillus cisolokensis TaxID=1658519 RepID=UPI003D2A5F2E
MSRDLLQEIADVMRAEWNIAIAGSRPIRRGYMNEKWMLQTNAGPLFVKSYHPERYRKHQETVWREIGQALRLQAAFRQAGGACPALLESGGQRLLHRTASGRMFVVMTGCPGRMIPAGKATPEQMRSLGAAAAFMHAVWNDGNLAAAAEERPAQPLWTVDLPGLMKQWEQRQEEAAGAPSATLQALQLQRSIIGRLVPGEWADECPGWTHLDLWADNLLFESDKLAAIVDFDRVRYSHPMLDLGRAVLSLTLDRGAFRREAAAALAEGYRQIRPLAKGRLLHAVRHAWLVESFWWIRPGMDRFSTAPHRFAREMLWTAGQWDELEHVLGNI